MKRNIFVLISFFAIVACAENPLRLRRSTGACGIPKVSSGLIVNGQSFTRGDFPWMVGLMYSKVYPPTYFCAGTLISSTFVVSAAHCIAVKHSLETFLARDIQAFFGAHSLNNYFESGRYSLSPKKIFIHDDWNPHTTQYDADLSLLEFEEGSIHFNTFVQPICFWNLESEPTETEGTVTGWGRSGDSSKKHEDEPKRIKVLIKSQENCFLETKALVDLSSTRTFCAGGLRNSTGVCFGDSGGGLFIKVQGVYHLRGVVSSSLLKGEDCDVSKNAVYTNVLKFRDWINRMTQAERPVFCSFETLRSWCCGTLSTCLVNQGIGSEEFFLGSALDDTVKLFEIFNNKEVKFLPRQIGEKFPNLKELGVRSCDLTIVRNHYFKRMGNLQLFTLSRNRIASIESNSFKDLVSVEWMDLSHNLIETLDEELFVTMVNLRSLDMIFNKIKFLSPATFKIPGGKLFWVDLKANGCIDGVFRPYNLDQLEHNIRANCTR